MRGFYLPPDKEHTFSKSYFHEEHILDVSTTEERIQSMNLKTVKILYDLSSHQYEQETTAPYKNNRIVLLK